MKGYKFELNGEIYTLCYTGEAFFKIDELVGDKEFSEAFTLTTDEGFKRLCKAAAILSEQGELVRQYYGYPRGEALDAEELTLILSPVDRVALYGAVIDAILLGLHREVSDKQKEVSLTRQRMLKKKESD